MEEKKFIATIKVIKPVGDILKVGGIYRLDEVRRQFPFISFNNTDYFEIQYEDKFKKGDLVRCIVENLGEYNWKISKKKIYCVKDVIHEFQNCILYTKYIICSRDNSEEFTVEEKHLDFAKNKWLVSFSQERTSEKPGIHELDYFTWEKRIRGTWKEMFTFDTKKEAEDVAKLFSENTIKEIMNLVKLGKYVIGLKSNNSSII